MSENKCANSYIALTILAYSKFKLHLDSAVKEVKSTSSKNHKQKN